MTAAALVDVHWSALYPVLAPALAAVLVLVVDVLSPVRRRTHLGIGLAGLLLGAAATFPGIALPGTDGRSSFCLDGAGGPQGPACLYAAGPSASGLQLAALVTAAAVLALSWPAWSAAVRGRTSVLVALLLTCTTGAVAVAGAQDLGSLLVALELATLPSVALVALHSGPSAGGRRSVDGGLALLTTSLLSFALLALAAGCWYAATRSGLLGADAALAAAGEEGPRAVLVLAVVLFVAGIGFKLSLVPFHAWTPQAYVGAPVPIAAFLALTSKAAALGALLVVIRAVTVLGAPALTAIAVVSVLSMTLGNVLALRQDDLVRLLAWSTVAQAGWVVLPLAVVSSRAVGASAGYLLVYLLATLVAFAVLVGVAHARGDRTPYTLSGNRGLLRTHPLAGTALALALLTLAGLPPAVIGLVGKVVALRPVAADGLWWLAVVAAANVVLGIAVYLRWLRVVLDRSGETGQPDQTRGIGGAGGTGRPRAQAGASREHAWRRWHPAHLVVVGLGLAGIVLTSLAPQLLLSLVG